MFNWAVVYLQVGNQCSSIGSILRLSLQNTSLSDLKEKTVSTLQKFADDSKGKTRRPGWLLWS